MFNWLFPSSQPNTDVEQIVKRLEETRLERELALREAIIERKNAYKIAESRERFKWTAGTAVMTILTSAVAAVHHKNIFYSIAIFPACILMGYEANNAYGKRMDLIFTEMENVFKDTTHRLSTRLITVKEIDSRVEDIICSPEALD